jgi:hypothetical protein
MPAELFCGWRASAAASASGAVQARRTKRKGKINMNYNNPYDVMGTKSEWGHPSDHVLRERITALEAALAQCNPWVTAVLPNGNMRGTCKLCDCMSGENHKPDCLWRQANEAAPAAGKEAQE